MEITTLPRNAKRPEPTDVVSSGLISVYRWKAGPPEGRPVILCAVRYKGVGSSTKDGA